MIESFDPGDSDKFREMFGPGQIDSQLRSLLQMSWMSLPSDKKSIDELERLFRPMVDRAFRDMRDDRDAFGLPG